jgi:hypothetical protein
MTLYNWNQITEEPLNPLATRQMMLGSSITIARLRTRKAAWSPFSMVIAPNVPHSVESLEDCVAVGTMRICVSSRGLCRTTSAASDGIPTRLGRDWQIRTTWQPHCEKFG